MEVYGVNSSWVGCSHDNDASQSLLMESSTQSFIIVLIHLASLSDEIFVGEFS